LALFSITTGERCVHERLRDLDHEGDIREIFFWEIHERLGELDLGSFFYFNRLRYLNHEAVGLEGDIREIVFFGGDIHEIWGELDRGSFFRESVETWHLLFFAWPKIY